MAWDKSVRNKAYLTVLKLYRAINIKYAQISIPTLACTVRMISISERLQHRAILSYVLLHDPFGNTPS